MPHPDFTQGDPIPDQAEHDWNLGPTGLRGWIYSEKLSTSKARQIKVTRVEAGSPADGRIQVGDVILGLGKKAFTSDPRVELGEAVGVAEATDGRLILRRWRDGKVSEVTLSLPVLGSYSPTAPYDCAKSARILEQGCKNLAARMREEPYAPPPIPRALNALALLADGDPAHRSLIRREVEWASQFHADAMATWYYGYVIMLLAEYHLVTGEEWVMPGLERLALEAARGQSVVGSWGHKFAAADGRLQGYGMMNAPGVPLTTGLVMARGAGVESPDIDQAIERSLKLLRFYEGKGAIPYGDHDPWIQTHEDNGKAGMAAVLFNLVEEESPATFFSRMSLASHGPEREMGHTGNFWNILWAMPAVNLSGPQATGAWMETFGGWYFDLARRWDGQFQHQGPAQARRDSTHGWDATGLYLLAYAMPKHELWLTGARAAGRPRLDRDEAREIIEDGRGWAQHDRHSFYDALSDGALLDRLGSWSQVVRERAALALARRSFSGQDRLLAMMGDESLQRRIGACQALRHLGPKAAAAVPALRNALQAEDMWLRVEAARALGAVGSAGMVALPELLQKIAVGPTKHDPRAMEQRYLVQVVFREMLNKGSLEEVDTTLLHEAIRAGLRNEDGRTRGVVGSVYERLSFAELEPLLPAIHQAVIERSPSGMMFSDGIRLAGLQLLAKHRIREGIPLCFEVMRIQYWGKRNRIPKCLDALESYGVAAKPMLPELRKLADDLRSHKEAKGLVDIRKRVEKMIESLEAAEGTVELRSLTG
jgi:hypothetical protein